MLGVRDSCRLLRLLLHNDRMATTMLQLLRPRRLRLGCCGCCSARPGFGIAVDPVDGSLWISNMGTRRVVHLSSTGAFLGQFTTNAGE